MPRFVAKEDDLGGAAALQVLAALGCSTAFLNGDGTIGSGDVVFFTGHKLTHWPSKWLRISSRHLEEIRPRWAEQAGAVIAVRPGKDFSEDGFKAAMLSVAQSLGAVPSPRGKRKRKPRTNRRAYALRPRY
jgi:hypothetical protein